LFRDLFGRPQRSPDPRIHRRREVVRRLRAVAASRALVSIRVSGSKDWHNSAILSVDEPGGFLRLDRIASPQGHRDLLRTRLLKVVSRLDGAYLEFSAALAPRGRSDQGPGYLVVLPEAVTHQERRGEVRVPVCELVSLQAQVIPAFQQPPLECEVKDLSNNGVALLVADVIDFQAGQVLPSFTLSLPRHGRLSCRLAVAYVRRDPATRVVRVGGRFLDLSPLQAWRVRAFLSEMQNRLARAGRG
jgi:c-di-GMP-binding flagellar brake protein YcgR